MFAILFAGALRSAKRHFSRSFWGRRVKAPALSTYRRRAPNGKDGPNREFQPPRMISGPRGVVSIKNWRRHKKSCCGSLFIRYNALMAVTRRQKEVLDFLESFVARNGYSPSFEEIARGMGLKSLATVHKHITNLEKKGLLDRVHNRSRSIDVLPPGTRTRSSDRLPLAGRITAGMPVEAVETQESISLHDVVGNRDVFALEVRGDSMRDEHIISGDYVLVERTRTARQGEIVVALVHGAETTLKRFYTEGNVVRLQPANLEMEPIYVPAAQVAIQGRVLGVLRKYR
jgi:repressor LexA